MSFRNQLFDFVEKVRDIYSPTIYSYLLENIDIILVQASFISSWAASVQFIKLGRFHPIQLEVD